VAPDRGLRAGGNDDAARFYSPAEEARITEQLHALASGVHRGEFSLVVLDERLIRALHYNIFNGVRDFAGRCRSDDWGSERLTFGPHRSTHRSEVAAEVKQTFEKFGAALHRLESNPSDSDYDRETLRVALLLHAAIIRIHPFEDGNGRSSRMLANVVLVRLGLRPIIWEVPKQEYLAALNHYFASGDVTPLLDLALTVLLVGGPAHPFY
jgi:fido (protein-threonine AMPylation protein)